MSNIVEILGLVQQVYPFNKVVRGWKRARLQLTIRVCSLKLILNVTNSSNSPIASMALPYSY